MGSTQTEPNALLDTEEERVRQEEIKLWRSRLSSINQQKAALEKEAEVIREYLRITKSHTS